MILGTKENTEHMITLREHYIKFTPEEWKDLADCKPLSRVIGYSKGYYRLKVKMTKIKDPYI